MSYDQLVTYFKDNGTNEIEFSEKFEKDGKQGITGLVKLGGNLCVYKTSRYLNFGMNHEFLLMQSLNEIYPFCPYFCRSIGKFTHKADSNYKKKDNPFEHTSAHPILHDTLLMEYLPYPKLYELIKDTQITNEVLFATIKQILMSLAIVSKLKNFSHYDLHSCNILMKKCDKNRVYLYVLNEDNQICYPNIWIYT